MKKTNLKESQCIIIRKCDCESYLDFGYCDYFIEEDGICKFSEGKDCTNKQAGINSLNQALKAEIERIEGCDE